MFAPKLPIISDYVSKIKVAISNISKFYMHPFLVIYHFHIIYVNSFSRLFHNFQLSFPQVND